jgi:hypothetical protein
MSPNSSECDVTPSRGTSCRIVRGNRVFAAGDDQRLTHANP